MTFIQDQEGHKGGEISDLLCDAFFVFAMQIFYLHLIFFNFGFDISKIEFEKDILDIGIELNFPRLILKIWMICKFFVRGGSEDTRRDVRPCCRHVTEQNA